MKRVEKEPAKRLENQPEKKRMKKPAKIALIALLALLVLGGSVFGYIHSKLRLIDYDDGKPDTEQTGQDGDKTRQAEKEQIQRIIDGDDPDVQAQQDAMEEAVQELEVVSWTPPMSEMEILHDDNVINILLIGTDERSDGFSSSARGDSIMILSLNKATGSAKLVSLERAIGVPILSGQYQGQWDWLTHTFAYGGADLMLREVRECFRVDVERYIRVNFNTFRQGIEAIGGVDITISQAEADYLNRELNATGYFAGTNHMSGWGALSYARCREIDSDWTRIQRQRTVIQAAINATRGLSVGELDNLLNSVLPLVRTNLTEGEILSLLTLAPRFQGVTLSQRTIPASGTYGGMRGMGGRYLYAPDFDANAKILRDFLYG